jgi:small subunit ribosomal protein S6
MAAQAEPQKYREYETVYVLKPDANKDTLSRVSARVEEVMTREGGKLTLVESWGRRNLAYNITKYRHGIYMYVKYLGQGGVVAELERNLRMLDDVMRFSTVRVTDEVDDATLTAAGVKFEEVELEPYTHEAESLERILGLDETSRMESRGRRDDDEYADDSDGSEISDDAIPDLNSGDAK